MASDPIKSGAARQALILPTTPDALRFRSLLSDLGLVALTVGRSDFLPALSPAQALEHVERLNPDKGVSIVVFGDQLVSAMDAPIFVRAGTVYQYLSSIEYLLNQLHGFQLRFSVAPKQSIDLDSCSPAAAIFSAYVDYLACCAAQGQNWLARSTQEMRYPAFRRRQQKIRVQALRSSLLHMTTMGKHSWNASYDEKFQILERIYATGRP